MIRYQDLSPDAIQALFVRYGIVIQCVQQDQDIPHSFWGSPEAGRLVETLYIRADTPIHSLLHESGHYICMPGAQRKQRVVDAKGSAMEENACCYLQVLLADRLEGYDREQLMKDMDDWGYSFRLGSAKSWFTEDAEEVKKWLIEHKIINPDGEITWQLRQN